MVRPKKHLGQHFLTDPSIARRITDALVPDGPSTVIEIGPGTGVLTGELLLRQELRLIPVEIDHEAVEYLLQKYPGLAPSLQETDFLKADLSAFISGPFYVIGNFPYNISSQIFFKLLEYRENLVQVVCMLQKEVAERLVAGPGTKDYGILSVLLQAYFDAEYLFTVKPGSFFPPPAVNSAVIRLTRNSVSQLGCDEKLFRNIVKTTFNQRRKTIRNSIRPILPVEASEHELLTRRPEQLAVSEFVNLTNWVSGRKSDQ
ncbi:MAG: 16S rRNA (adenine(1518)-N(6)/adenine(1519)-N(6))-dimethyltransferase RsmA [Bacteroidota bacterium]